MEWMLILEVHPQFAGKCNWETFESDYWCWLLEKQPQFADRCHCWTSPLAVSVARVWKNTKKCKTADFALDVFRLEKSSLISAVFAHLESQAELFQIFAQTVRVISCVALFP